VEFKIVPGALKVLVPEITSSVRAKAASASA
jgi:hypothetical protein